MPDQTPAEQLALRFVTLIRRCTTQTEYNEILKRNKTIAPGCCATHDFMDANMVMLEAFNQLYGRDISMTGTDADEPDRVLWGAAWKIATEQYLTEK